MMDSLANDGEARPDAGAQAPQPTPSVVGQASGQQLQLADCLVGLVTSEKVEATDSMIILAVTDQLEGENVHVLWTPKTAAIFGAALGLACALFLRWIGGPRD